MPQHTPRRALEKFRKSGADPDFAERPRLDALANEALMDKRRFNDSDYSVVVKSRDPHRIRGSGRFIELGDRTR